MDGITFVREVESLLAKIGTQKEDFYRDSGITSATMSQYRSGLYNPSKRTIAKAAAYFGITIAELTDLKQKEPPSTQEGGGLDAEFLRLFQMLTPEQRARELAYLRELTGGKDK